MSQITNLESILNPEGTSAESRYGLAPRRFRSLDGVRLGLLGNTKLNADAVLLEIANLLKERYAIESVYLKTKPYFGKPAPDEIVRDVIDHSDVVIAGVGD